MVVREFEPGEEPALRDVFYSSVHGIASRNYTPQQLQAWAPPEYDQDKWIERINRNRSFIAVIDGEIAGFSDVQETGYIDQFYVASRFAGIGVGTALMKYIHQVAALRNLPELSSHVSLTAEPFFTRHGFKIVKRNMVDVKGVILRNATMRKTLLPA
jgi:putative acetyltransferase